MEKSLYFQYVEKFFPSLVTEVIERINEQRNNNQPYLFRTILRPRYSADSRWESILADYKRVAADVVALDSELPLKSRGSLAHKTGDIPKLGMKLALTEKQMKDIDSMIMSSTANRALFPQIIQNIFSDLPACLNGVYERLEDMTLSGLSTGIALSASNDGTGARVDYGYLDANKKGVTKVWTDPDAPIIDDIQAVFDKALVDQNTITDVWLDDYVLSCMYKNNQVKQLFAFNVNFVGANVPTLDRTQVESILSRRWGVNVHRVARAIRTEINGQTKTHKPWQEGMIVFTGSDVVGDLVWTEVAEASPLHRVPSVVYQTADEFILLSKYSVTDPLREITSSQAMAVPVINNVDRIYTIDSKSVQA